MAAYAATVTSLMKRAVKVDNVTGIGMFAGKCDITNYNPTLAVIVGIRDKFRSGGVISVVGGITEGGKWVEWIDVSNSFKAYISNVTTGVTEEVAIDVDVGEFDFVAYGLI